MFPLASHTSALHRMQPLTLLHQSEMVSVTMMSSRQCRVENAQSESTHLADGREGRRQLAGPGIVPKQRERRSSGKVTLRSSSRRRRPTKVNPRRRRRRRSTPRPQARSRGRRSPAIGFSLHHRTRLASRESVYWDVAVLNEEEGRRGGGGGWAAGEGM